MQFDTKMMLIIYFGYSSYLNQTSIHAFPSSFIPLYDLNHSNGRVLGVILFSVIMRISNSILSLFNGHDPVKINEDEELSTGGKFIKGIYLIKKGAVKIFKRSGSGDFILWIGFEGDVIGLEQLLTDELNDKVYLALKNSEIVFIPLNDVKQEMTKNKQLFSDVLHYMSDFSNELEQRIVNINQRSVLTNFSALLLNLSKLKVTEIVPKIISTKDIAHLIGTTTNYVYKTIQKLENKSIITFKERRLRIINRELLRKMATENSAD